MDSAVEIKRITEIDEMLRHFHLIKFLNPDMEFERYAQLLQQMVANNYQMVGVFLNGNCAGLSGFWVGTKLYSGKYLEIDNFVIDEQYRSRRFGKLLVDWLTAEATQLQCETMMLDAYVVNHAAHKFYLREGFVIKGFHFLKFL